MPDGPGSAYTRNLVESLRVLSRLPTFEKDLRARCRAEIETVFNTALADAIEGKQLAQISTDCRTAIETELCQLLHEVLGDEICVNF